MESLKAILIQARTTFSSNIYVGLSRKLDLRISLHACEAWEQDSEKNAFLNALGMQFVDWMNEGQVEGSVICAGECSDGSCLRTAFSTLESGMHQKKRVSTWVSVSACEFKNVAHASTGESKM